MQTFGDAFWKDEFQKAKCDRHPLAAWYFEIMDHLESPRESGEDDAFAPLGAFSSFLLFAMDLHTLADERLILPIFLKRLKCKQGFQGARYELFVTALLIRCNFQIVLEDELSGLQKHVELVATCRRTGIKYEVEAKSRHRSGVLGRPGERLPNHKIRLDIGHLINEAIAKYRNEQMIIFIDVNLPPNDAEKPFESSWFRSILKSIDHNLENRNLEDRYTAIVFTNFPNHYAEVGESIGPNEWYIVMSKRFGLDESLMPIPVRMIYDELGRYVDRFPREFS